jgi:type III secretion protein Q
MAPVAEVKSALTPRSSSMTAAGAPSWPPLYHPSEVVALNAFTRLQKPIEVTVGALALRISFHSLVQAREPSPFRVVQARLGGRPVALSLQQTLLMHLLVGNDPELDIERLRPQEAALLLEYYLTKSITMLESLLDTPVQIEAVSPHGSLVNGFVTFHISVTESNFGTSFGELHISPTDALGLASLADAGTADSPNEPAITFSAAVRIGATDLAIDMLGDLLPGDIVLLDHHCGDGRAVVVLAEHVAAPATIDVSSISLTVTPALARGSYWEWYMENTTKPSAPNDAKDFADIPVRLVFEIGRVDLPLHDVKRLAIGTILPMHRPVDEAVDIIANGKRIGRGSVVRIGDTIGVRIGRLLDDA